MSYVHSDPSTISRSSTIQKWEQAFIVLVPISIASILLLLFYFYYLRRQRGLESGLASSESYNIDISKQPELGLKKETREMLPVVVYKESFSVGDALCSVCRGNYQTDDRLQQIPVCGHLFHKDCIGYWLNTHTTCPLCRLSLLPPTKTVVESVDIQLEISHGAFVAENNNEISLEENSQACNEEKKAIQFSPR